MCMMNSGFVWSFDWNDISISNRPVNLIVWRFNNRDVTEGTKYSYNKTSKNNNTIEWYAVETHDYSPDAGSQLNTRYPYTWYCLG